LSQPDLDFHGTLVRIVLQLETQPFADALHGAVLGQNVGGNPLEFFLATDLDEPPQQLRAQPVALKMSLTNTAISASLAPCAGSN
jgi:hypothetical protein